MGYPLRYRARRRSFLAAAALAVAASTAGRGEGAGDAQPLSAREMVAELTHLFVVGEHLAIQPDLQYIVGPGGSGRIPDAFVAGLRLTLSF